MTELHPDFFKYFKKENFTKFEEMDVESLNLLVKFRIAINTPIIITSSNGGAHAPKSQHYLGKAFDLMFPKYEGKLHDLLTIAVKIGFKGIGLYPHWHYNGKQIGGIHIDTRDNVARWIGVMKGSRQELIGFNPENLVKYRLT